jgi:hypothetical protein
MSRQAVWMEKTWNTKLWLENLRARDDLGNLGSVKL